MFFWLKAHAGMELNETADIMAKAGAALEMDRNWHETDYEGLVYQDVTEEDAFMQQGTRAKQFARDFSLEVERDRCKESVTSRWLRDVSS
eukprot:2574031-Rhodomonas_salina.1